MKIRADFVTNSSSSSYVDIYADNPVLNELLDKYNETTDDAYMHFTTDWCDEHENLDYPNTLLEFLHLVGNSIQEETGRKETALLSSFRYAKYNTGFHYTDGYLSGEEHHVTLSSRWGVVDQHTWIDEDKVYEDDDDEDYNEGDDDEDNDEYKDDDEDYDEEDEDDDEYDENDEDDDNGDEDEYDNLVPNRSRGSND